MNSFLRTWRYMSRKEKDELADRVGVQKVYLTQIAGGHAKPSPELKEKLVDAGLDREMFA